MLAKIDLRILQITFLSIFLWYGIEILNWDVSYYNLGILFLVGLITQTFFCNAFTIPINALMSAIITCLGISLILRTNYTFIYGLTGLFSISSKYIFRINHKHFYNPANFGIIFIIFFTGLAWLSPAQWGSSMIILFAVGSMGLLILTNLKKIDLAVFFILFYYGGLFLINIVYKGWPIDHFIHEISSGSLVLFTFFMITDPSSTPNNRIGRMIWVFLVSMLALYLGQVLYWRGAPLYALFFLSPLVPVIDYIFKGDFVFAWDSLKYQKLYSNDPSNPVVS